MKKKILILVLSLVLIMGLLVGCDEGTTSRREADYTSTVKQQSLDTVGLPNISNFFEMSELKSIYELRDDPNLTCYWYIKSEMTGKWIYQGTCVGYGIPYSTQITNPDTTVADAKGYTGSGYTESSAISQAEPNGLYSPSSTDATWILSVTSDGNIKPTYVESNITVSQTKINSRLCETWSLTTDY